MGWSTCPNSDSEEEEIALLNSASVSDSTNPKGGLFGTESGLGTDASVIVAGVNGLGIDSVVGQSSNTLPSTGRNARDGINRGLTSRGKFHGVTKPTKGRVKRRLRKVEGSDSSMSETEEAMRDIVKN